MTAGDVQTNSSGRIRPLRPFLKWAGGKRQLLPQLRCFVPPEFRNYHEPFFGSGALFFDLCEQGRLAGHRARLIDSNVDLTGCYRAIAQDVDAVIAELQLLAVGHLASGDAHYYRVRDKLFNPRRRELFAEGTTMRYPADLAAMFIYLNRTGFNGLFRLNSRGDFNVPAGRYVHPQICNASALRRVASVLCSENVDLACGTFESVLTHARTGDLIYFDPPYAPVSTTSRFTSYTAAGFSDVDQQRLQTVVFELVRRRCHVILSNSTAPIVADLYERHRDTRKLRLRTYRVPARRAINADASRRGDVMEFIVTNVRSTGVPPPRAQSRAFLIASCAGKTIR